MNAITPLLLTPLLNVDDAAASVRFYCDKLGFEVTSRFEDKEKLMWAQLSCGPIQMMINVSGERDPQSGVKKNDGIILYFSIDDVHSLHRELRLKGCAPGSIERQDYGLDEFTLRDPDGYALAFVSPVKP